GQSLDFNQTLEQSACGKKYAVLNDGQCSGDTCPDLDKTCLNGQCLDALIYGNIKWEKDKYIDDIWIEPICNKMPTGPLTSLEGSVANNNISEQSRVYRIGKNDFNANEDGKDRTQLFDKISETTCKGTWYNGLKGFVVKIQVNDDREIENGDTGFFTARLDDEFVLGNNCAVPFFSKDANGKSLYDMEDINWAEVSDAQLFKAEDFIRGAQCDFNITVGVFPYQD
ncbi:MAG: hypothetical protein Q8L21_03710, partial [Candidatus Komeilibacteria bacterium]|nr:hypothetical protein [Candidatus Komeilibacteria bacterium]